MKHIKLKRIAAIFMLLCVFPSLLGNAPSVSHAEHEHCCDGSCHEHAKGIVAQSVARTSGSGSYIHRYCPFCEEYRDWTFEATSRSDGMHTMVKYCDVCGYTETNVQPHHLQHYRNGQDKCFACDEIVQCRCQEYCTHTYGVTKKTTTACAWNETCNNCGKVMNTGTTHSEYKYGDYVYVDETTHKRDATCTVCGTTTMEQLPHEYGTTYIPIDSSTHTKKDVCKFCTHEITSTEPHIDANHDAKCDLCGQLLTVTVTWDAASNGGKIGGANSTDTTVMNGSKAVAPPIVPDKRGHTFTGWYSQKSGGALYDANIITANTVFYAQFSANKYTVLFNANGGACGETQRTVTFGQNYGTLPTPTHDRFHTFDGWFTSAVGGTQITSASQVDTTDTQALFAHWTKLVIFSVTVPTSLPLTLTDIGEVRSANSACIINNSSDPVKVSGITLIGKNGWTIVPFTTDMSHEKVDARFIGLSLNGIATKQRILTESIATTGDWSISTDGRLPLSYSAVVSACSESVENQEILDVVFMVVWA